MRPADIRVGVDLVPVRRVAAMMTSSPSVVLGRMLTPRELDLSRTATGWDAPGAAGRLAAKEAVFKLLRTGGRVLPWLAIEVLKGPGEWPHVQLTGTAAELARSAGINDIDISITHDDQFAVAVAACAVRHAAQSDTTGSQIPQGR